MSNVFGGAGATALLDTLIPESDDGRLPGAGSLGLGAYVEERAAELAPILEGALTALDERAAQRGGADFAALAPADREALLRAYADEDPVLVPALVFHLYAGYYQHPQVLAALGHEPRPPYPQGYAMEPMDPSRVDRVRGRAKLYREA